MGIVYVRRLAVALAVAALCTGTAASAQVHPGDTDADFDVDLRDVGAMQLCFSGSIGGAGFEPPGNPDCLVWFDGDRDGDLDLIDFDVVRCAFGGPGTSFPAVVVNDPISPTDSTIVEISGIAAGWPSVEIIGDTSTAFVVVDDCSFSASVELQPNRVNQFFVRGVLGDGTTSSPTALQIAQDEQLPSLFIDFPADGVDLTTATTDVAGRVGDLLSGFMGLTVTVNGVEAIVDVGIGNNGTFFLPNIPLASGENAIIAVATDVLGNTRERQINVTLVNIPPDAPQMAVAFGNGQDAQIGMLLPQPIVIAVTQGDGTPFANKLVTFDVTRSNGRLTADGTGEGAMRLQLFTDVAGEAQAFWRLGFDAGCGNNRVEVTSGDVVGSTFFCASAAPAPAGQINIGTGNNQRAESGGVSPEPLRVWVSDACNGVSGIPVTFRATSGGGKVNGQNGVTVLTTMTGHAEVEFTLGPDPGNNTVEATFPSNLGSAARFVVFGMVRDEETPTSFSGMVLNNADQPLQGAACTLVVQGSALQNTSDVDGKFSFPNVAGSGPADLFIDGLTAFHVGGEGGTDIPIGSYPKLHFEPVLVPNAKNSLPTPVLLPMLDPNNTVAFDNTEDVELTVQGIEGLKMLVSAGSMTNPDGSVPSPANPTTLMLNQVRHDKIPMPMPDGAAPPFAWTLQPGGATFDPPVKIVYPNMSGLAAGSIAYFLSFDHDTMRFEIVASGHVTDDAQNIISDAGAGIATAGWGCNCPPYSVTGDCCHCSECYICEDSACVPDEDADPCCFILCGSCFLCEGGECVSPVPENPCCGAPDGAPCDRDDDRCTLEICENEGCILTGMHECGFIFAECSNQSTGLPCADGDSCTGDGTCGESACNPGVRNCSCDEDGTVCAVASPDQCLLGECLAGNCVATHAIIASGAEVCCPPCTAGQTCCGGVCCDSLNQCQVCHADECFDTLSDCQRCLNGVAEDDCTAPCEECIVGECESILTNCQVCVDGVPQDDCPNPCEDCIVGSCQSTLLGECDRCENDVPVSTCASCEACVAGVCLSVLQPCEDCVNGIPTTRSCDSCKTCVNDVCESVLFACQVCQDGVPVDNCGGNVCCGGAPGEGVCCDSCEVCADGECLPSVLLACQVCQDGVPVDNCGGNLCCGGAAGEGVCCAPCDICVNGECLSVLQSCDDCVDGVPTPRLECGPCEVCVDDECIPTIQSCQDCVNGVPTPRECGPCEVCVDDACQTILLACQTCEDGEVVDNCGGNECCGDTPGQGSCCSTGQSCENGVCVTP